MQRSNPTIARFYQSSAWKRCKKAYMSSKMYICERCKNSAEICHHKKYISLDNIDDPDITLSWGNLEALCMNCHNKEHFGEVKEYYFDADGNVMKKGKI